jgi:5-methylcytosine-specific restriction enzyme subunit McrC
VDAKYKLYDDKGVPPDDVYQSFLYAFAYGRADQSALPSPVLLYPASSAASETIRLHVRRSGGPPGAELHALGVHIPTALAEAETGRAGPLGTSILSFVTSKFVIVAAASALDGNAGPLRW